VLQAQRKDKEALAQSEKALSLQPNFIEPLNLIVGIHINQKDVKKSVQRVEAQIQLQPKNAFFYNLLGRFGNSTGTWSRPKPLIRRPSNWTPT
jgi:predicted Zn-dependent protease